MFLSALLAPLCQCGGNLYAQVEFGMAYTTELQTNFRSEQTLEDETVVPSFNYVNLLRLNLAVRLSHACSFQASTLSTVRTSRNALTDTYQSPSNIEAGNLPLVLAVAGVEWHSTRTDSIGRRHTVFGGIRNMNEDYFTSDVTSLFTINSGGIYPTISANYHIADYPLSSVGIHYAYQAPDFIIQASIYNGSGNSSFYGRDNMFRFCPDADGLFFLTQGEYRYRGSRYFLGGALHYGEMEDDIHHHGRTTLWAYAEQVVTPSLTLLGGYSHAFHHDSPCTDFACLGGQLTLGTWTLGLLTDYVHIYDDNEWATELTCTKPLNRHVTLQPAFHFIRNGFGTNFSGMMRVKVNF